MTLDPTLLTILACPSDDHAPLRAESRDGADTLVCTFCATRYPVRDGIPVLLLDDATPGPNGIGVAAPAPEPEPEPEPEPAVLPVDEVVVAEPAAGSASASSSASSSAVSPPADAPEAPVPAAPAGVSAVRSRRAGLRDRVQQRLAELEATRGPRGKRRDGT